MTFDAEEHRRASLESWEGAAPGWESRQQMIREWGAPVSHWLVQALDPQPGQRLLEVAAGMGETGLLAAELVAPIGTVVISDYAEAMIAGAERRAAELGAANVEFKVMGGEWLDMPLASIDGIMCRWGYMLMADPPAGLAEARRVLRPGGRIALAVWDELSANPWAALPVEELIAQGFMPAPDAGLRSDGTGQDDAEDFEPGPFSLARPGRIEQLLLEAGFAEVVVEKIELVRHHESFEDLWEVTLDLSPSLHNAAMSRTPQELEALREGLQLRFEPFCDDSGGLTVPGRTLVVSADA